jgi:hypothetical protein
MIGTSSWTSRFDLFIKIMIACHKINTCWRQRQTDLGIDAFLSVIKKPKADWWLLYKRKMLMSAQNVMP